jgi:hypothetical protein
VITVTTCRECHREDHHNLSCSHVRYEGRTDIAEGDEVAVAHEPPQPYCPGPDACHFGPSSLVGVCSYSDGPCYYGEQSIEDWESEHPAAVALLATHLSADEIRAALTEGY